MLQQQSHLIDFQNTELAFQAKSDRELNRTYRLFQLVDSPFITRIGPKLLNVAMALRLPVKPLVKISLFDLFCGGESLEETEQTARHLAKFGVTTILDFSVEAEKDENGFERTYQEFMKSLVFAEAKEAIRFSAVKVSGIADIKLLEKRQAGQELSKEEQKTLHRGFQRLQNIARTAAEKQVPIFIDAEESWVQDEIDAWTEALMEQYNTERPWIYTTVQLYRKDRLQYLRELIQRSKECGYQLGVKLVRGAYMEKEKARAAQMMYPNPIQDSKADTDRDFNEGLRLCLKHISHVWLCNGSHNEESNRLLAELMIQQGLAPSDGRVWFAQLYGMSDNLSFNLAHAGFNAAKYLPYGPVMDVIPYLLRRAEENTAIAGQSSREVVLLRGERRRRRNG